MSNWDAFSDVQDKQELLQSEHRPQVAYHHRSKWLLAVMGLVSWLFRLGLRRMDKKLRGKP